MAKKKTTSKKKVTKKVPIEDNPSLVRDEHSKGIINRNHSKYLQRVKQRQAARDASVKEKEMEKRLNRLEGMMQQILEKLG